MIDKKFILSSGSAEDFDDQVESLKKRLDNERKLDSNYVELMNETRNGLISEAVKVSSISDTDSERMHFVRLSNVTSGDFGIQEDPDPVRRLAKLSFYVTNDATIFPPIVSIEDPPRPRSEKQWDAYNGAVMKPLILEVTDSGTGYVEVDEVYAVYERVGDIDTLVNGDYIEALVGLKILSVSGATVGNVYSITNAEDLEFELSSGQGTRLSIDPTTPVPAVGDFISITSQDIIDTRVFDSNAANANVFLRDKITDVKYYFSSMEKIQRWAKRWNSGVFLRYNDMFGTYDFAKQDGVYSRSLDSMKSMQENLKIRDAFLNEI